MVWAMLTIAFHMLMYFVRQPKGLFGKLFGLLPAILVCAFLVLKPVTSLMNWYYTQEHFTKQARAPRDDVWMSQCICSCVWGCD